MQTPAPKRSGWILPISAVVIGLTAAIIFSFIWGLSVVLPLVVFAIIAVCVGLNWLMMTAWDRWRNR